MLTGILSVFRWMEWGRLYEDLIPKGVQFLVLLSNKPRLAQQ